MTKLRLLILSLILAAFTPGISAQVWDPGWFSRFEQVIPVDSSHYLVLGDNSNQPRTAKYIARIRKTPTGYELQETTYIHDTILNLSISDSSMIVLQRIRQGCDYFPNDLYLSTHSVYDFSQSRSKPLWTLGGEHATLINDSLLMMFEWLSGMIYFYDTSLTKVDSVPNPISLPIFFHEDSKHKYTLIQETSSLYLLNHNGMFNFDWFNGSFMDFTTISSWNLPSTISQVRFFKADSIAIFTKDSLYLTDTNLGTPASYALPTYDKLQMLEEHFLAFNANTIRKYRLANMQQSWSRQVSLSLARLKTGYLDPSDPDSTILTYSSDFGRHCEIGMFGIDDPKLNEMVDIRVDSLEYLSTISGPGGYQNQSNFLLYLSNTGMDTIYNARLSHGVYAQYNYCQREFERNLQLLIPPGKDTSMSISINHYYPNSNICVYLSTANQAFEISPGDNADCFQVPLSQNDYHYPSFSIYPNPAQAGLIHLDGLTGLSGQLALIDCEGKVLLNRETVHWDEPHLDVTALSNGVYILTFLNKDGLLLRQKLVIQK